MKSCSGFIISIFLALIITSSAQAQTDCKKVDLKVETTDARDGKNGSITVSAKNSSVPFRLHLLGKGNGRGTKDDQLNITSGTIGNIKPGRYELVIHYDDATWCTETRKVTIN